MGQSTQLYIAGQGAGAAQDRRVAINTQGANNASLPALQVFSSTAETAFTDPAVANSIPMALAIPPGGPCEQEKFAIVASGYVLTKQSSTIVFKLRLGNSATVASNTLVVTTPSVTVATTSAPFSLTVECVYDSVSGKFDVSGTSFCLNGTATAPTIASMPITPSPALSNVNNPVVTFTLTATFGTGSAGTPNSINLKNFAVNH